MGFSKYLNNSLYTALILLCLYSSFLISKKAEKPLLFITKQQSSLNIDNKFLKYFNLGQKRLVSSLLWIATILESDHDHYKARDLNSWMYLRFLSISNLEPEFLLTYTFGGPYLSIVKDDLEGASIIYDKGLSFYPEEFSLLRDAAFHYQFEKMDYNKSYPLYKKLQSFPHMNPIITSQLARLETQRGQPEVAFYLLKSMYDQLKDKDTILGRKVHENLYALKSEIDLTCLNSHKSNCEYKDFDGYFYVKKNNVYGALKEWKPFRVKKHLNK